MAHSNSAKKRIRQNVRRHARNKWRLRKMRRALKAFEDRIIHGTVDEAQTAFREACQIVDKTAQKGPIHKRHAARRKSRMSKRLLVKKQAA